MKNTPLRRLSLIVAVFALLSVIRPVPAAAEDTHAGKQEKTGWSLPADPLRPINELGIGTFSGKAQMLFMRRAWDNTTGRDEDAHATTMALTLDYRSPRYRGFQFGSEFIQVWEMLEGGSTADPRGAAQQLCNSDYTIMNNAFIEYRFDALELPKTRVRGGRQPLDLFYAPAYPIRQKKQAYTALVGSSKDLTDFDLSVGHIQRFSSWCSRDEGNVGGLGWDFKNVGQVVGTKERTAGMQFFDAAYTGIPDAELGLWDFYGQDTFNTFGINGAYTFEPFESFFVVPKLAYSTQTDVGDFTSKTGREVDSDVLDVAAEFEYAGFNVEPGYFIVWGDGEDNDYQLPFRSKFTIDPLLMWYPRRFKGGSESFYVKSTYRWRNTSFYVLYVRTQTADFVDGGSLDQEANLVVSQKIWEGLSATFKGGYGIRDVDLPGAENPDQSDLRVFLTYEF
jgi:hypothetical protein